MFQDELQRGNGFLLRSYRSNVLYVNQRVTGHPGLVFLAASESDVQKGVLFARKYNLLLLVRGANAQTLDYTGRFTVDGGFVIDLSLMNAVSPTSLVFSLDAESVTVQAGAKWQDVYNQIDTSRIVVGTNPSDSVYETTLTGGISPISRSLGLVVDNLLSARVVLADGRMATLTSTGATIEGADGKVVTTDDAELFYALKGGGFNWAVPVSFTFRLFFPPNQVAYVDGLYNLYIDGTFLGRDALNFVLREIVNLPTQWGGYIMIDGSPSAVDPADKVRERLDVNILDNYRQYRDASGERDVFDSGNNAYVFNSLLDRNVFDNATRLSNLVEGLLSVVNTPSVNSNKRCIGRLLGGAISSASRDFDAVSENLRTATMSLTCGLTWNGSILKDSFLVDDAIDSADSVSKMFGDGVDPRFAAEDLPSWKSDLYGSKYKLLLEVKSRWDVDNFLWSHNGIASDFHLDCRRGRCRHP
nr:hypothetical protein BaRGS_021676 [Batillaria attramentaria]